MSIDYTATVHELLNKAKELFNSFTRRQLIRLIGIRFTELIPGTYQINFFNDIQEMIHQIY